MRMLAVFAFALMGYFVTDAPVAARDSNTVIQVMLAELGHQRPENCPGRWCACYLDNVLARSGLAPRGSNIARDFANYGAPAEPGQIGAIMVMSNHVGVVVGTCGNGQVRLNRHRTASGGQKHFQRNCIADNGHGWPFSGSDQAPVTDDAGQLLL